MKKFSSLLNLLISYFITFLYIYLPCTDDTAGVETSPFLYSYIYICVCVKSDLQKKNICRKSYLQYKQCKLFTKKIGRWKMINYEVSLSCTDITELSLVKYSWCANETLWKYKVKTSRINEQKIGWPAHYNVQDLS